MNFVPGFIVPKILQERLNVFGFRCDHHKEKKETIPWRRLLLQACLSACIFIPRNVHEKGSKLCLLGFWRKLQNRLKDLEGKFFFRLKLSTAGKLLV